MTLHESASAAQARWAAGYIRQHRRRRRFAWILAVALAGCVGFGIFCVVGGVWWNALLVSLFFTLVPLICIQYAAEYSIDGFPAAAEWLTAWVIFLLDGAVLLGHYHDSGRLAYGVAQASCAAGVPLLLALGLRIPPDPSIDWDGVLADFLIRARTARSGKACPYRISDYAQAEEMAAAWLRRFGYRDAAVSGKSSSGNDGGIDVYSAGAVAQVKYWLTTRVGLPEVQRLVGSSEPGQARFFFAASGYTGKAATWAASSDHKVALFIIGADGNLTAVNYWAKKALWFAPFRMPSVLRKPRQAWHGVVSAVTLGLATVVFLAAGICLLAAPRVKSGSAGLIVIVMSLAILSLLLFILTSAASLWKLLRAVKDYRRYRQWPGWRSIFAEPPRDDCDAGLPPDEFTGYCGPAPLRIFGMIIDLASAIRLCRRMAASRAGRHT